MRLIAATDSDLESAVARREFREPLMRRFSYEIRVPPLRARRDDIGILFYHLLRERLASMGETRRLSGEGGDGGPWARRRRTSRTWCGTTGPATYASSPTSRWRSPSRTAIARARASATSCAACCARAPRPGPSRRAPAKPAAISRRRASCRKRTSYCATRREVENPERAAKRLGISKSHLYKRAASIGVIRLAKDLSDAEIRAAMESARGDLDEAAERLRVSGRGLRLRLKR